MITENQLQFQVPSEFIETVPHWVQVSLAAYFNQHRQPGSLLRAVLKNDLEDVACHLFASQIWDALPSIVRLLHIAAPSKGYGSAEAVAAWLAPPPPAAPETAQEEEIEEQVEELRLHDLIERIAREVVLKREKELEAMAQ